MENCIFCAVSKAAEQARRYPLAQRRILTSLVVCQPSRAKGYKKK